MHRRFKFKAVRAEKSQKKEELDEEEKYDLIKEKIFAPIVWCRLSSGFRIQDLKERYYDQALDMMKKHYGNEDVLLKSAGVLDDFLSRRSFLNACSFQMRDTTSLLAVDESTGQDIVAGVCLLRAVSRIDFGRVFSRTMLRQGEAYNKCTDIKTALNRKVDIYADYDCEIFLRIYSICVKPEFRNKRIGFALFRTTFRVARALKIPIIMGIFDNHRTQTIAGQLGFTVAAEIKYDEWKDGLGNVIFVNTGPNNDSCALMIAKVEPELYPEFLIEKPAEPIPEIDPKKGKKNKKDKKGKKDKKDKKKGKK